MQMGLTKKLSDYTGIKIAPADASIDPLFSWSANLLTIQRKKTIVCMNDASRFAFILHGVKAADAKTLDQLIVDGIRACMAMEAVAPEIIERYLSDGRGNLTAPEVAYTKTSSRKAWRRSIRSALMWKTWARAIWKRFLHTVKSWR